VQFTIEVYPETTQLKVELVNTTDREGDIDLFVRFGQPVEIYCRPEGCETCGEEGDQWIRADYLSRDYGGVERLTITARSDPPLRPGIYYIAVDNFEREPQEYTVTATLTPPPPPPGCSPESIRLNPNESLMEQLIGAKAITETVKQQYCIDVGKGAKLLAVALQSQEAANANIDMHIRSGKPVERAGNVVVADFSLVSPDGNEFIIISEAQLKSGPYYIAVENLEATEQKFAIAAAPLPALPAIESGKPVQGTVGPVTGLLSFLSQYLKSERGMLALQQYVIKVPEGAKSLMIKLEGAGNIDLHLRFGKPIEIADGKIVADLSSLSPGGTEAIVLSGALLQPGVYYIAIEGLEPPQNYTLTVTMTIEEGKGQQTIVPNQTL